MASKFYFSSKARQPVTLGGKVFRFSVFSLNGGSASGVYEATDPDEIRILDDAVQGRRGVRAMGEAEGLDCKKKAESQNLSSSSTASSKPRVAGPPILPQLSVEERPGVPFAGRPTGTTPEQTLFSGPQTNRPSIANLLKIGRVNPPKPFADSHDKTAKAVKRADKKAAAKGEKRPSIRVIRGSEGTAK